MDGNTYEVMQTVIASACSVGIKSQIAEKAHEQRFRKVGNSVQQALGNTLHVDVTC